MKTASLKIFRGLALGVLLLAGLAPEAHAAPNAAVVEPPISETKPFHGTLRAKDLRLGTLSLGSPAKITRILALDPASRLNKGIHPAALADFAVGDVIEGFAFPDSYGRMVVAVATASARPLDSSESKKRKASKPHKSRGTGGGRHRSAAPASMKPAPTTQPSTAPPPRVAPPICKAKPAGKNHPAKSRPVTPHARK